MNREKSNSGIGLDLLANKEKTKKEKKGKGEEKERAHKSEPGRGSKRCALLHSTILKVNRENHFQPRRP